MAAADNVLRFRVQVQPRARQAKVAGRHGDALKLQVEAPPVDGAANDEVVALLADALGVPRRAVRIAHGASCRSKLVEVECGDLDACRERLEKLGAGVAER